MGEMSDRADRRCQGHGRRRAREQQAGRARCRRQRQPTKVSSSRRACRRRAQDSLAGRAGRLVNAKTGPGPGDPSPLRADRDGDRTHGHPDRASTDARPARAGASDLALVLRRSLTAARRDATHDDGAGARLLALPRDPVGAARGPWRLLARRQPGRRERLDPTCPTGDPAEAATLLATACAALWSRRHSGLAMTIVGLVLALWATTPPQRR